METLRPLLNWDKQAGFLPDWHIAGFFNSGLRFDPSPNLLDKKISDLWTVDHLAPYGGTARPLDAMTHTDRLSIGWKLYPIFEPVVNKPSFSITAARAQFTDWETALKGIDPDSWDKLYYALAIVDSPRDLSARLVFSGWDGCRLWVNGELKHDEHCFHHVIIDQNATDVRLIKGRNTFLFQLDRDGVAARLECDKPDDLNSLKSVAVGTPPVARTISTFEQLRQMAGALTVQKPFNGKTKSELNAWQADFRTFYRSRLGPVPTVPATEPKLIEEIRDDGITIRRYHFKCEGNAIIPGYVMLPDESNRNGRTIMLAHGHAARFAMLTGIKKPSGPNLGVGPYRGNYGRKLAQKGFITAVVCERAFEERLDHFSSSDACNAASFRAEMMGYTLPMLHILDVWRMTDFLETLPGVNPARIGISGLSGGGTLSYLSGAYDERYKAVAVFCGLCRYLDYALGAGCGMQVVPGLFPVGETGEILSLIAPRPLLLAQGRLDATFNVVRVKSIAADAMRAYQAAGVPANLRTSIYELAHQYDVDIAERFFLESL